MLSDVLAVIMGGGRGSRLWPLTRMRAKPAVPIGGKYRLIDIPVSNCLNSDIHQIAILTQFNSVSLHRHITHTYQFDFFHTGSVQILAAEQTTTSAAWYQGTADAVRKQMLEIFETGAKDVLILAGDHLYRMDYGEMVASHRENGADVTVGVLPVPKEDTARFGILKLNDRGRVTAFVEKPKTAAALKGFRSGSDRQRPYLGSMGIYLFRISVLAELLQSDHDDFGSDVLPAAIKSHRVFGHPFDGYWEDIGTIRAFYNANIGLTAPEPRFRFHDPQAPIYTHPRFLPGSLVHNSNLDQALLADGCIVSGASIKESVIGIRSIIGSNAVIERTVMMGADAYEAEARLPPQGSPPIGVGNRSYISGAIIDKNARIGADVRIEPFLEGVDLDGEDWAVRDGVVVISKNAVVPSGTVISPRT
jgi:glucose-1-phosphate adenylyltransferase